VGCFEFGSFWGEKICGVWRENVWSFSIGLFLTMCDFECRCVRMFEIKMRWCKMTCRDINTTDGWGYCWVTPSNGGEPDVEGDVSIGI